MSLVLLKIGTASLMRSRSGPTRLQRARAAPCSAESVALGLLSAEAGRKVAPVFSSLSRSNIGSEGEVIEVIPGRIGYVEAEVGVLIGRRIEGPDVTPSIAFAGIDGFLPVIDLAQIPLSRPYGIAHTLATMAGRYDTTCVFGPKLSARTVNLQLEGMLVSVNGEPRTSATAWESLGGPVNGVAWLANELAHVGAALEPGQVVVTGVCPYPQRLAPGDVTGRADYTTLGSVTVRVRVSE